MKLLKNAVLGYNVCLDRFPGRKNCSLGMNALTDVHTGLGNSGNTGGLGYRTLLRRAMPGRATHFRVAVRDAGGCEEKTLLRTACGRYGSGHRASYDPRDVDCISCRRTARYGRATGRNSIPDK